MTFSVFAVILAMIIATVSCPVTAILGGHRVEKGYDWDLYVHFGSTDDSDPDFVCGGVLLSWEGCVLTAAHCGITPGQHVAYFKTRKRHKHEKHRAEVVSVMSHPKYDDDENINPDFAIVKLADCDRETLEPLGVRTAVIECALYDKKRGVRPGPRAHFMGFGCDRSYPLGGSCTPSKHLKWGYAPVVDSKVCQCSWVSGNPRRIICLDGEDITVCGGDSGSPIMIEHKDPGTQESRMVLAGIIIRVAGETNCQKGANIIVASVQRQCGWISKHI